MEKKTFICKDLTEANSIMLDDGRKIYLTEHAKDRLKSRHISDEQIKETFINPDIIVPNKDFANAKNYEKTIDGTRLKIGIKCTEEPFVLITAFFK
jgi:hypothetical protein